MEGKGWGSSGTFSFSHSLPNYRRSSHGSRGRPSSHSTYQDRPLPSRSSNRDTDPPHTRPSPLRTPHGPTRASSSTGRPTPLLPTPPGPPRSGPLSTFIQTGIVLPHTGYSSRTSPKNGPYPGPRPTSLTSPPLSGRPPRSPAYPGLGLSGPPPVGSSPLGSKRENRGYSDRSRRLSGFSLSCGTLEGGGVRRGLTLGMSPGTE